MSMLAHLRRAMQFERYAVRPTQPTPSQSPSGGPGTELTRILSTLGFDYSQDGLCPCAKHAYQMDRLGPVWCDYNRSTIVGWIQAELDRRRQSSSENPKGSPSFGEQLLNYGIEPAVKLAVWLSTLKGAASRIFLIGYPGAMGGANTEALHLLKLWKRYGMEIHLIPTWGCDPANEASMTELGFQTHHVTPERIHEVPGLEGSITVGMCNQHYTHMFGRLRELKCKLVWMNCMTFLFGHERQAFGQHGCPDAMIYQSRFQQRLLTRALHPYENTPTPNYVIPGAFDPSLFPYRFSPRTNWQDPFVIGKLARPDPDKWPRNLWTLMESVHHPGRQGRAMGCTAQTYLHIGQTPEWAISYPPQQLSAQEFLGSLHCLFAPNGGAAENWPRVGLEAMSAGVPLIVPNAWGWQEMIRHEETGFLADTDEDYGKYGTILANDEPYRERIAKQARHELVEHHANADHQWISWLRVFYDLHAQDVPPAPDSNINGGVSVGLINPSEARTSP